jgi:DNA-binding transcriptional LysR family regulator
LDRLISLTRKSHELKLTLRQLQIFHQVADSGTTASAAAALALSQSATSAAINELERLLDLNLFDRIGKRLQLNDNGRALLPAALEVLQAVTLIERWAVDRESQIGAFRIGASTTIGNYLLPELLAGFRNQLSSRARTGWDLQVRIANTAEIASEVASFKLDMGLIEGPCYDPALAVRPWREDELVLVAAPGDPIVPTSRPRKVSLQALRDSTWLLREAGSGTREVVSRLLIPHLHRLPSGIEFGTSEAIKRAAANGLGITCLSRCVVEDFLRNGLLVALRTELPRLTRQFSLVTHAKKRATRGMDHLMRYLE